MQRHPPRSDEAVSDFQALLHHKHLLEDDEAAWDGVGAAQQFQFRELCTEVRMLPPIAMGKGSLSCSHATQL